MPKPSYLTLQAMIAERDETISRLDTTVTNLREEIDDLEKKTEHLTAGQGALIETSTRLLMNLEKVIDVNVQSTKLCEKMFDKIERDSLTFVDATK